MNEQGKVFKGVFILATRLSLHWREEKTPRSAAESELLHGNILEQKAFSLILIFWCIKT